MRRVLLVVLVFCLSLCAANSREQFHPLKKLSVVALDAHGQPVSNLTSTDFHIYDDGKLQPIVWFRFRGGNSAQAALAQGEYSNHTSVPGGNVVILFDMMDNRLFGDASVRTEIVDGLRNFESGERVYLYLLTPRGELFPVHPLPMPDTELKPEAEPWTRHVEPMLDQAMKPFIGVRPVDEFDIKVRYEQTVDALNDLANRMLETSGRKNLVWVTHGFPIYGYSISVRSVIDFTDALNRFYEHLALSQIFVYPADQSVEGAAADLASNSTATLQAAAELTGGRRLTSDRVDEAVSDALTDSRASYEVAYQAEAQKLDGKRHKIRVTTERKDVRLQNAQAYYVLPPIAPEKLERDAFDTAIHSPFDATDIGVRASISPEPSIKSLNVNIFLDRDDLLFLPSGQNFTGHVDLVLAAYDSGGLKQASEPASLDFNLTHDQFEAASHNGLAIRQTIAVADSAQHLRVIVHDPALNATGSVDVPIRP